MTAAAEGLRANLIGAWTLVSFESRSLDGSSVIYPFGPDAQGIIMYTPDGYMSAQLMRAGRTPFHCDDPHRSRVDAGALDETTQSVGVEVDGVDAGIGAVGFPSPDGGVPRR